MRLKKDIWFKVQKGITEDITLNKIYFIGLMMIVYGRNM